MPFRVPRRKKISELPVNPLLLVDHQIEFDLAELQAQPESRKSSITVRFTNPTEYDLDVYMYFKCPSKEYLFYTGQLIERFNFWKLRKERFGPYYPTYTHEFMVPSQQSHEFTIQTLVSPRNFVPHIIYFTWHLRASVQQVEYRVYQGEGQIHLLSSPSSSSSPSSN